MSRHVHIEDNEMALTDAQRDQAMKLLEQAITTIPGKGIEIEEQFDGWAWRKDTTSGLWYLSYEYESLYDDARPALFLNALAPAVPAGQYIEMVSEYGEHWRYSFDGQTCVYKAGTVSY